MHGQDFFSRKYREKYNFVNLWLRPARHFVRFLCSGLSRRDRGYFQLTAVMDKPRLLLVHKPLRLSPAQGAAHMTRFLTVCSFVPAEPPVFSGRQSVPFFPDERAVAGLLPRLFLPAVLLLFCLVPPPVFAAESYTLEKAVTTALERNFTISASKAAHRAAEEGTKSARSAFGPVIGTGYDYERRQHRFDISGKEQEKNLYTWRTTLSQNVFSGFATLAAYQRAALAQESAAAGKIKARIDLVNMVQEHFFTYLKAKQDVVSARDSLERLQSQLASSRAFYEVGVSPRIDVLQAEVDVSTAESALLIAENTVATERARLNTLLVLPMTDEVEYTGSLDYIPFTLPLGTCLELAYRQRPDLIMAEKSVQIAAKDTVTAKSAFYPQITALGMWSTRGDDFRAAGSSIYPTNYSAWSVGIFGEWAIFEWGRTYYATRQSQQIEARVRAEADNLRQEISFTVKARLLDSTEAAKRIKVAQKAVEQAREAYRMADARYKSQVGTMTDVLDAQAKLSFAEASLAGARADYNIALSRLYAAMGEENHTLLPR